VPERGARPTTTHPLDCSRPTTALFWLFVGSVVALSLLVTQAAGDRTRLLHIGSTNPLLPQIERDLGHVVTTDAIGHDGQFNYLIARDPFGGRSTPAALSVFDTNGPRYRYRRILLPLIAGGIGQFSGVWTVTLLIALTALGIGLATVATADLAFQWNVKSGTAFAAMMNASAFIASGLLTSEPFALGLALTGIALFLRGRRTFAAVAFAAAGLTKETYALVPLAFAAWSWRNQKATSAALCVASLLPLVLWSAWVTARFTGSSTGGNVGIPFVGFAQAIPIWITSEHETIEMLPAVLVMSALVIALAAVVLRSGVTRYLLVPWLVLAMCSTLDVWGKANNPARVFAILWPLGVLSVGLHAGGGVRNRSGKDRLEVVGASGFEPLTPAV
jgi:hypothetical protein